MSFVLANACASVLKSWTDPTSSQCGEWPWNTGPSANPSAGSVNAPAATAPAPFTVPTMNRRRVTVSPSKAPGMLRSAVYFGLGSLRLRRSGIEFLAWDLGSRKIPGGPPPGV